MWEVCEICGAITGIGMAEKHAQWHAAQAPAAPEVEEAPNGDQPA